MSLSGPPRRKLLRVALVVASSFLFFSLIRRESPFRRVRIQHEFPQKSFLQTERQNAVKREFLHAWSGYEDHGWMADSLMPLSGGQNTKFCSWSATLVDSLDSLWIMGFHEEFERAINATMTIDFKHNAQSCQVSLFESTIRYLGGLLGAYDLSEEPRLLPKLVEVGDMLYSAFNTSNGMPCSFCHLASKQDEENFEPSSDVSMADIGSLYLEFGRLSQITKDDKYINAVVFLTNVFARTQGDSSIPGLWPEQVDASSVDDERLFAKRSSTYSLGALSDSSYEYLLKGHMLMGGLTSLYSDMWKMAAQQIRNFMLFRAFIPDAEKTDILFSGVATRYPGTDTATLEPRTQHLACFAGGLFAIASKVFNEPDDFEIGKQLTNGCVWAYQHSPTGIMPETFTMLPCPDADGYQCEWNATQWAIETGKTEGCEDGFCPAHFPDGFFSVGSAIYALRPEAIESVFVMWRMTGNEYWRDVGWEMFQSIIKHTRTPFGHAALSSVMDQSLQQRFEQGVLVQTPRAPQNDDMESFWLAETLKYFYLLFSEPDLIDLDKWVLNTEAHPLRLTKGLRGF